MNHELHNRIARRILSILLSYSREFGGLNTLLECDTLGLSAQEFGEVVDDLTSKGLVISGDREPGETCFLTEEGAATANSEEKLASLFPVEGDPKSPLPSEIRTFGRRPFEPVLNPPASMDWDEYTEHLRIVWPRLLNSDRQHDESVFQDFLERHPCLLPQAYASFGRGATPKRFAFFAEPELPGFRAKRPDFMTIAWDSDSVIAFLVEIEAPAKPWATQSGGTSAKLTQALGQLREWKTWFREPENIIQFTKLYGIDQRTMETRQFEQRYGLVYGRRAEVEANQKFAKERALLSQWDEILMTYDRLAPDHRMARYPTVRPNRSKANSKFEVIHIPPIMKLGPFFADEFVQFSGMRDAVRNNRLISKERRDFLIDRLDYWDHWSGCTPVLDGIEVQTYYDE